MIFELILILLCMATVITTLIYCRLECKALRRRVNYYARRDIDRISHLYQRVCRLERERE